MNFVWRKNNKLASIDVQFKKNSDEDLMKLLKIHVSTRIKIKNITSSSCIYKNYLSKYQRGKLSVEILTKLKSINCNFTPTRKNITPNNYILWKNVIKQLSKNNKNIGNMMWLKNYLSYFRESFVNVKDYSSVPE